MKRYLFRIIGFFFIIGIVLFAATKLLMPTWFLWNTDNTVKGIYKEPENRIQVLFLGSSSVVNGISPMILYKNNGFCAYNLGTPEQPLLSSYYWLQEIERLHPETLHTVILDTYFLFNKEASFEANEKALTYMRLSPLKKEAFQACAEQYGNINVLNYLFPISAYHSRWAQVNEDDIDGYTGERNYYYSRGQNVSFSMAFKTSNPDEMEIPDYGITRESDYTEEEYQKILDNGSPDYLQKIRDFCNERQLNLVLIGLPHPAYRDLHHDAVQYYCDANSIPFLDFNLTEIQEEIGFNMAYDMMNPTHPNYMGAEKITDYIGSFLEASYHIEDVRNNRDYAYLAEQAEDYAEFEAIAELQRCEKPEDYLSLINNSRYSVFVTVKGNAAPGMTAAVREAAVGLGLYNLSAITDDTAYVGLIDRGTVFVDAGTDDPRNIIIAYGDIDIDGNYSLNGIYTRTEADGNYSLEKKDRSFSMASAGTHAGNYANMSVDGAERSENQTGLNFAVYDNVLKSFISKSSFDASSPYCKRTDLEIPSAYQKRLDTVKLKNTKTFSQYIDSVMKMNTHTLFIVGNMSGQKEFLQPEEIDRLQTYGLSNIHEINNRPYIAVIQNGRILQQDVFGTGEPVQLTGIEPILFHFSQEQYLIDVFIATQKWTVEKDSVFVLTWEDDTAISRKTFM